MRLDLLDARRHLLRRAFVVVACATLVYFLGSRPNPLGAQPPDDSPPVGTIPVTEDQTDAEQPSGDGTSSGAFGLKKIDNKTSDLIADFQRYSGKKSWELAFRALTALEESKSKGMAPTGDGFYIPVPVRVRESLLALPPEGREAYRLFNDASAKKLWDAARDSVGGAKPGDELVALRRIVDQYFLSSVGDLAADRLGDAMFEAGNFAAAEQLWRLVVQRYPDPHVAPGRLQVKRCLALAQMGRRDALAELVGEVQRKYGDLTVKLGGKDQNAAEFVAALQQNAGGSSAAATATVASSADAAPAIELPSTDEPLWQIQLLPPGKTEESLAGQNVDLSMVRSASRQSACVLGGKFFANWLGVVYAADLSTGKLLWQTNKFREGLEKVREAPSYGISIDGYFLVPYKEKLIVGRTNPANSLGAPTVTPQDNSDDHTLHLECIDAATGKTDWIHRPNNWSLVCPPYIVDDVAYIVDEANVSNNPQLQLEALDLKKGERKWTAQLGSAKSGRNNRGMFHFGGAKLILIADTMYVATDSGALLAVDLATRQIRWAFLYETQMSQDNDGQVFWVNGAPVTAFRAATNLFYVDGLLYLKEGPAKAMYVIDPLAPALKWKRPIGADESLVDIRGEAAYLVDRDAALSLLDLKSRDLVWSTRVGGQCPTMQLLAGRQQILVPSRRGIVEIDPADGSPKRVFRGADRKSLSLHLLVAEDKLISIGDTCVTAYKVEPAKASKPLAGAVNDRR